MNRIKLDNHKGLPMYFIKEKIQGLDYKINFSDVNIASIGDELGLGIFIFRVDEIKECRISPLDYGVNVPVNFHSVVAKIVRRIDMVIENGVKVAKEIVVS